ncbi:endonuclease domain-containing 1 protein-like [Stegostoma tigrinum]|uniref:endonuclease domain-containing 1 protein-like n=1 Tax=Stegostoma tigrinum TaxID=3053191 RepID=UPI00202AFDBB|nr:endonuclease domain-containing 1 protein-like [Stegostoma tigrinum]
METRILLSLLLWALPQSGTVQGEVVRDFKECDWFFQNKTPPKGFPMRRRLRICQRFKNHYHYATLYNSGLRIPVYSAYRYPCTMGQSAGYRPSPWFYEPQIDDQNAPGTMRSSSASFSQNQAVDEDYQDSGYDRGHLYPFALNEKESATATCTLTNAVPKEHTANVNWYHEAESIVEKLARICHKSGRSMYLMTGAANPTMTKMKNRVSVPGMVWTALCCTYPGDQNNDPCLNSNAGSEGKDVLRYNRDFSFALMKQMKPERSTIHSTVRQLQKKLRVDRLFDNCRGMSENEEAEIFKVVEGLIQGKIIDSVSGGSSPLRPFSYEVHVGIFRFIHHKLLAPGQSVVRVVLRNVMQFATTIAPIFHGILLVLGVLAINTFGILINN